MEFGEMSVHKHVDVLRELWNRDRGGGFICPLCHGSLTIIQMNPVDRFDSLYTPYHTVIECAKCSFRLETESFTLLGSVKQFDAHSVELAGWSPSGSRVVSRFEHMIDYGVLKDLKDSAELVEFLIVDNQVVQVIG